MGSETTHLSDYYELIDLIALGDNSQAIIAFCPSETTQNRAYKLVHKEREGQLTAGEFAELSHYVELEHILRMAKIKAQKLALQQTY